MNTTRLPQRSSRLRALLRGAGSMFDLFPPAPRPRETDDSAAIAADWRAVGDDLRTVMDDFQVVSSEGKEIRR